ncbi:hypothetical protein RhiirA5_405878 [Rhizophagus irregularis]|uniref:Uncharacterized protein n=1 Tax=Rhizophagus irregularis TaxID=588596 RepID=A0A2N0QEB5_9GLOM|nr:hypothetical protein RhiirA5_405878 [Rhizophagus irregularis]
MHITKCDIIRDVARGIECGFCNALASNDSIPVACYQNLSTGESLPLPQNAVCLVPQIANNRMALFASRLDPRNVVGDKSTREEIIQTQKNLLTSIITSEQKLASSYPDALLDAEKIGWNDFTKCQWDPSGYPGGQFNNKYFGRLDLQSFGMQPTYPIGGKLAYNSIWHPDIRGNGVAPVPIWCRTPDEKELNIDAWLPKSYHRKPELSSMPSGVPFPLP